MKKILVVLLFILNANLINAQEYKEYTLFENEKLLIVQYVWDGQERLLTKTGISFYNLTNNNMRITYKVNCGISGLDIGTYRDFTYTNTVYVKPKGVISDYFIDGGAERKKLDDYARYLGVNAPNGEYNLRLTFNRSGFELINYGVENKNYETSY